MNKQQKDLADIIRQGKEWESLLTGNDEYLLYNLSPIRRNLLEWFPFSANGQALELDGQTGILTEALCRHVEKVTSIVADQADADINLARNGAYGNLKIVTGKIDRKEYEKKFDYVAMIGLGENFFSSCMDGSGQMLTAMGQYREILHFAKTCLKEGGNLILALNNRFGLQYWSGKTDRCSPYEYGSILEEEYGGEEYLISQKRLKSLLLQAGFMSQQWYYPVPDYKYPLSIFSDNYLPAVGDIRPASSHYGKDEYRLFDEKKVFDELCKEGLFEGFANSYLVICSL